MKNAREMRTKTGQIDDEYECEKKSHCCTNRSTMAVRAMAAETTKNIAHRKFEIRHPRIMYERTATMGCSD